MQERDRWRLIPRAPSGLPRRRRVVWPFWETVKNDQDACPCRPASARTCNPKMSRVARLDAVAAERPSTVAPAGAQKPGGFQVGLMHSYPAIALDRCLAA